VRNQANKEKERKKEPTKERKKERAVRKGKYQTRPFTPTRFSNAAMEHGHHRRPDAGRGRRNKNPPDESFLSYFFFPNLLFRIIKKPKK